MHRALFAWTMLGSEHAKEALRTIRDECTIADAGMFSKLSSEIVSVIFQNVDKLNTRQFLLVCKSFYIAVRDTGLAALQHKACAMSSMISQNPVQQLIAEKRSEFQIAEMLAASSHLSLHCAGDHCRAARMEHNSTQSSVEWSTFANLQTRCLSPSPARVMVASQRAAKMAVAANCGRAFFFSKHSFGSDVDGVSLKLVRVDADVRSVAWSPTGELASTAQWSIPRSLEDVCALSCDGSGELLVIISKEHVGHAARLWDCAQNTTVDVEMPVSFANRGYFPNQAWFLSSETDTAQPRGSAPRFAIAWNCNTDSLHENDMFRPRSPSVCTLTIVVYEYKEGVRVLHVVDDSNGSMAGMGLTTNPRASQNGERVVFTHFRGQEEFYLKMRVCLVVDVLKTDSHCTLSLQPHIGEGGRSMLIESAPSPDGRTIVLHGVENPRKFPQSVFEIFVQSNCTDLLLFSRVRQLRVPDASYSITSSEFVLPPALQFSPCGRFLIVNGVLTNRSPLVCFDFLMLKTGSAYCFELPFRSSDLPRCVFWTNSGVWVKCKRGSVLVRP